MGSMTWTRRSAKRRASLPLAPRAHLPGRSSQFEEHQCQHEARTCEQSLLGVEIRCARRATPAAGRYCHTAAGRGTPWFRASLWIFPVRLPLSLSLSLSPHTDVVVVFFCFCFCFLHACKSRGGGPKEGLSAAALMFDPLPIFQST